MRHLPLLFFLILLTTLYSCTESDGLALGLEKREVGAGQQVCVPVYANQFENILTMQYSIGWDPAVLTFTGVSGFGLPALSEQNFGRPPTHPDRLTLSWFEPSLQAISVPDGTVLFNVCFQAAGPAGAATEVYICDDPTIVEIANVREEVLKPKLLKGEVKVK